MMRFSILVQDTRRRALIMVAVTILGLLWIWTTSDTAATSTAGLIPSPREGFLAPDFTLETMSGDEVTLSDLRGKVVLVNLWASWCPPCRAEMPAIENIYRANKDKGLEVLAVNTTYQDDAQAAADFARSLSLTFHILLDQDGHVSRLYQLQALPTTYFIDRKGIIRSVVPGGPMKESLIQSKIADLLEESP